MGIAKGGSIKNRVGISTTLPERLLFGGSRRDNERKIAPSLRAALQHRIDSDVMFARCCECRDVPLVSTRNRRKYMGF